MANPTTNYGFVLPTPTDLVTDLPADFDVALQGVDTRLKALQPGTTLGDLFYASATANTNTRLGIGSSGQVLTVAAGVPAWGSASSPANATAFVATTQTTTSTSYTGLATASSVTVTTGTKALVMITCELEMTATTHRAFMSYAVSGATTIAASDTFAINMKIAAAQTVDAHSYAYIVTGLTAGSNVFTTQFRSSTGDTVYFGNRRISVMDMGS